MMLAPFAVLSLIFALLSLWIHRRLWLWGAFTLLAVIFAYLSHLIHLDILFVLLVLGTAHYMLSKHLIGIARLIPFLLAATLSFLLFFHKVPGFRPYELFGLYFHFDKPFIALFPLAFTIPLIQSQSHAGGILGTTLLLTLCLIALLLGPAYYYNVVKFDPHLPAVTPLFLLRDLFFVSMTEEGFFRGFLQREVTDAIPHRWGGLFSILLISFVFALCHTGSMIYIALCFVAGLFYGLIYHLTRSIEMPILCHFLINSTRYLLFT